MNAILIFSVLITTIVYSAFNAELQIKGEAVLRSKNDIRITGIEKVEYTSGVYEPYNCKYTKDTISMYIALGKNASITYEVEIANDTDLDYKISEIKSITNTNPNVLIETNIIQDSIIRKSEGKKYEITFTNNTSTEQQITYVNQYKFAEKNYVTIQKFAVNDTTKFRGSEYKDKIKTITLSNEINEPSNVIDSWDLGADEKSNIKGYLVVNDNDTTMYDLYIQGDGELYANPNSQYLFGGLTNLEKINNLDILNTSNTTYMYSMFNGCRNLKEIDFNNFDTSNVTSMSNMFYNCKGLTSLDLRPFDASNVTTMRNMFLGSSNLQDIDLSTLDTSNVRDTNGMFYGLSGMAIIDISSFDTSKVQDSAEMFSGCTNLETIYVGAKWTVNSITNSGYMFRSCTKLFGAVPFDSTKLDKEMANYTNGYLTYKA